MVPRPLRPSRMENIFRRALGFGTPKRSLKSYSALSNEHIDASLDPYSYTAGRWLKDDQMQRESRLVKFDFSRLCQKAIEACPSSNEIVRYQKKEGSFNRVFILHMDDGNTVVARVPFRIAGPRRLATNSEVATINYLRSKTTIPVPEVLAWDDNPFNSIGTEYIIMEHAHGVQLHEKWPSMTSHQHMLSVKALGKLVREMACLSFPAYGSLYFADAPIADHLKIDLGEGFCVGPHCGGPIWPCRPAELDLNYEKTLNRGPWTDLQAYFSGLIEAGLSRIPTEDLPIDELPYRGSIREHLRLIRASDQVIRELAKNPVIQNIAAPMLLHPDLNKRNICVSENYPTNITALIDWQCTSIEPVLAYANEMPDLITHPVNISLSHSDNTEPPFNDTNPETVKLRKDVEICRQTFEVAMKGWVPRFHQARITDETLLRVIRYCGTSWRDSAAALRQELIELYQRWNELGLPGKCPYEPTADELEEHKLQYTDFEFFQSLKLFLIRATDSNSDGWVPADSFETAKQAHRAAFEAWIKTARENSDSTMNEEKARKLWPFDIL